MKILIAEKKLLYEMASILVKSPCEPFNDCDIDLEMIIFVNDSERNHLPHCHVQVRPQCDRGVNAAPIFETCIRLDSPEYDLHSSKLRPFPNDVWKSLFIQLISSEVTRRFDDKHTAWEWAVMQWDSSLSANTFIADDITMPDYSSLVVDENVIPSIARIVATLYR